MSLSGSRRSLAWSTPENEFLAVETFSMSPLGDAGAATDTAALFSASASAEQLTSWPTEVGDFWIPLKEMKEYF